MLREKLLTNLKNIGISVLLTIMGYMILGFCFLMFIIGPYKMEEIGHEKMKWFIASFLCILYTISFYLVCHKKRTETYSYHTIAFNTVEEIKSYMNNYGKCLFIIYLVLGIMCELTFYIPIKAVNKLYTFILWGPMPFCLIDIPIIRTLLSIIITCITTVISMLLKSYIIFYKKQGD